MAEAGAVCVASTGAHLFKGSAASIAVFPVVPDRDTYPQYGRDVDLTFFEVGLAGHWMKFLLHHVFIYQANLRPGWSLLPD
jgi:sulfide:quinone oxidoreductase